MKAATDDREVLKVEEAAALMRVTKNTADELIAKGEIWDRPWSMLRAARRQPNQHSRASLSASIRIYFRD